MVGAARRILGIRNLMCILSVTVVSALGGLALVGASLASGATPDVSGVPSSCSATSGSYGYKTCLYGQENFFGTEGYIGESNTNWFFSGPCGGTWNDCAQSLANHERYTNEFFIDTCYGGNEFTMYANTSNATLNPVAGGQNFDKDISSNNYLGDTNPPHC